MRTARGYTLVEVLIAVTVFAVLAATAYTALNGLSRAALEHRQRSADLASLQMALARLDADIRQIVSRTVRDVDGRRQPALVGQRQNLVATRAGWANPAMIERSNLQRFSWAYADGELIRTAWPVNDPVAASRPMGEPVLDGLRHQQWRYRDQTGRWHEQWPPEGVPAHVLPAALEMQIDSEIFGPVRRLLVLSP